MKVIRGLRISARQLGAHRTRTALALLGMVIGVSSVIAMVAVGHGARRDVMARVEAMGTDLIMVTPAQIRSSAGRAQIRGTVTTLTPRDANAILEEVPEIMAVAPWASKRMPVKFEALSSTTTILGVSPTVLEVLNVGTATGSFYTERDELTAGRSVVLGPTVARTLFGQRPAVGQKVLIGKVPFEVIGVLFPRGTDLSGTDQDDVVMIPLGRPSGGCSIRSGWAASTCEPGTGRKWSGRKTRFAGSSGTGTGWTASRLTTTSRSIPSRRSWLPNRRSG